MNPPVGWVYATDMEVAIINILRRYDWTEIHLAQLNEEALRHEVDVMTDRLRAGGMTFNPPAPAPQPPAPAHPVAAAFAPRYVEMLSDVERRASMEMRGGGTTDSDASLDEDSASDYSDKE